jgi:ADP-ribose pyrophosphatase
MTRNDGDRPPLLPWRVLSRRLAYDASPWVRHWVEAVELSDGRRVDDFHTIEGRDFAVAVAINLEGYVVAERAYRHGAAEVCLTLPAGYLEPGEAALDAARRELLEETGFGGGGWVHLGTFAVDGNRGCGRMHAFLARGVAPVAEPVPSGLEEVQVVLMPVSDLQAALLQGDVRTLSTAAALGLAALALGSDATAALPARPA